MNYSLDALAEQALHTLGELEASWVEGRRQHRLGRLGSWVPKGPGSARSLPDHGRLTVAVIRPAEPPLEAELVLVA